MTLRGSAPTSLGKWDTQSEYGWLGDGMEIDTRRVQEIKNMIPSGRGSAFAPRPVLEAVLSLLGEQKPVAALSAKAGDGERAGQWGCVLLTQSHLIYVQASREGDGDWDLDSKYQEATDLVGKMWSRDRIVRVEVRSVESELRNFGTSWRWEPVLAVVMDDGQEVPLPPDGEASGYSSSETLESFLTELRG